MMGDDYSREGFSTIILHVFGGDDSKPPFLE